MCIRDRFRDLPEACSHIRMSGDIEPDPAVQPVYALIKKRYAMLYLSLIHILSSAM